MKRHVHLVGQIIAAWRLAVLIQQDKITEPLRERYLSHWFPNVQEYVSAVRMGWRLTPSAMPGGGTQWVQDVKIPVKRPPGQGWEAFTQPDPDAPGRDWKAPPDPNPPLLVMGWQHAKGSFVGKMLNCMMCLTIWCGLAIRVAHRVPGLRALSAVLEVAGGALAVEYVLDACSTYTEGHRPTGG